MSENFQNPAFLGQAIPEILAQAVPELVSRVTTDWISPDPWGVLIKPGWKTRAPFQ